jgi:DNA helicase-2/ATP-dependent DNA helicase PcrA
MGVSVPALSPALEQALDEDQAAAVRAFGPNTVIVAGAGSGKTRVLTHGLAHLILDHGFSDSQLMLVTFTRLAAQEMRQRAETILQRPLDNLHCGTFHALGAQLLRANSRPFSVIDEQEALLLISDMFTDIEDEVDLGELPSPTQLLELFSMVTEQQTSPDSVLASFENGRYASSRRTIDGLYDTYAERKAARGLLDYADVLAELLTYLRTEPGRQFTGTLRAVLVDEAQDINSIQRQIIDQLCSEGAFRVMVGDPEQSIYGFRHADYSELFRQASDPDCTLVKMATNYRSYSEITEAAGRLIPSSPLRLDVTAARGTSGVMPQLLDPASAEEEAECVLEWAQQRTADGSTPSDLAVIARQHRHLDMIRLALAGAGLPVVNLGRRGGGETLDTARSLLIALMRLSADPFSRLGWQRLLPAFGFQSDEQQQFIRQLTATDDPFADLLERVDHPLLQQLFETVSSREPSADLWRDLCHGSFGMLMTDFEPDLSRRAGLIANLVAMTGDTQEAGEMFVDRMVCCGVEDDGREEGVRLGTVHGAKGLEWPHVFVVRVSQGSFPSLRVQQRELAEERRLLYVAMTRAQDTLTVGRARWLRSRFATKPDYELITDRLADAFATTEAEH